MNECKRCRQLENELVMAGSLFDAIHRIIVGQEISDFELSFPAVREVADLMASHKSIVARDSKSRGPCYVCGGVGIHEAYCSRGNNSP